MLLDKAVRDVRDVDLYAPDVTVKRRHVYIQTLNSHKYLEDQSDNEIHIHQWKINLKAKFALIQKHGTTYCVCVSGGGGLYPTHLLQTIVTGDAAFLKYFPAKTKTNFFLSTLMCSLI